MTSQTFITISEEFRKYLIAVKFWNKRYFTVSGSDLQDQEIDKLLVNDVKQLLLFSKMSDLIQYLNKSIALFDKNNFEQWTLHLSTNSKPYGEFDFDSLVSQIIDHNTVKNIYLAIGLIEDFAIQTQNENLLTNFREQNIKRFKENASDVVVWGKQRKLKIYSNLPIKLKQIYYDLTTSIYLFPDESL